MEISKIRSALARWSMETIQVSRVSVIPSLNLKTFHNLGIIYNNQMDDFSQPGMANYYGYAPSPANFIKPCKLTSSLRMRIEII